MGDHKRYEKYQRDPIRSEAPEADRDRKSTAQGKDYKEYAKPAKQEDSRKRQEGKFDYKKRPKDDRDRARTEGFISQEASVKSENKHTVGKDRRDMGRNNDRPYSANPYQTKEG